MDSFINKIATWLAKDELVQYNDRCYTVIEKSLDKIEEAMKRYPNGHKEGGKWWQTTTTSQNGKD